MADTSVTPNMNLVVPTVGEDPGPDWANNINADLGILDQHNHSNGQGVQITPAGLNINTDLPINGNNLTLTNTVRFNNLLSTLSGTSPNLGVIYEAVNELYFNDGVGNIVQITKSGSINATSSGISSGTATAGFVGGVLVVDSNVNTPANIQGGSVLFGNNISGSNFATVQPPNSLASNYNLTLPPNNGTGSTVFMTYDASNNMGIGPATTAGITGANIANQTLTQGLRAVGAVSSTSAVAGGILLTTPNSYSGSGTGNINIISGSITTTGRPVWVTFQPGSSNSDGVFVVTNGSIEIEIITSITNFIYVTAFGSSVNQQLVLPLGSVGYLDTSIVGLPGTYTYSCSIIGGAGGTSWQVDNVSLAIYEI